MHRSPGRTSEKSLPPGRLTSWGIPILFCALAFGMSVLLYDRAFSTYDDGVAAEGARLVLRGKVPYKDFWTIYAPGSYYANALLFAVFGESFFSFRLILPVLVMIQAGFLYGIGKRIVTDARAAAAAAAAYLAFVPIGIYITTPLTYWFTATAAVVYFLTRWIESPAAKWEYACGISLGIAALFRQDGGLYAAAVLLPMVLVVSPKVNAARGAAALRMFGSFAGVLALTAGYFAAKGALAPMFEDTIKFAVGAFPHSRQYPYPLPADQLTIIAKHHAPLPVAFVYQLFTFYLLPGALAVLGLVSVRRLFRDRMNRVEITAAVICCLALVLFLMVRVRPIPMRILGSVVLGLVTFAALGSDRSKVVRIGAAIALAVSIVAYLPFAVSTVVAHRRYGSTLLVGKGGIRVGGGYADMISIASSYVRRHTRPSEKILSGTPAVYFTAERDPATKYYEPHPLLTDTPEIQRKVIRDLERERVRYFVRSTEWVSLGALPSANERERDVYFTIEREHQPRMLIDYIERNYRQVLYCGVLQVYERKTPFRCR